MVNQGDVLEYAIFETGGKQYQGIVGKTISVERIAAEAGTTITLDKVLLRRTSNGVEVGAPLVKGSIKAEIVKHLRGPKIIVFKFRRRKKYRCKQGHRQELTVIRITALN
jgi:large subunit ribosomal protein L21